MAPAARDDADRLPLEQVVGPRVRAGLGHAAVRLHHARPGAHEEQRRGRRPVRQLREQEPGAAAGRVGVPDVAVRGLGADQEPGAVGRLAVDRVELARAAPGRRPRRARRRSAPCSRTGATSCAGRPRGPSSSAVQVDHARRDGLDRRRRRASRPPRRASPTAPPSSGPAPRSISGSIRRWLDPAARAQARSRRGSVRRATAAASQRRQDRAARRVGERPRQRARPAEQDLGARRRPPGVEEAARRPAVDGLDARPARELEVGAAGVRLDERVPGGRGRASAPRPAAARHPRPRRRMRSSTIPTIRRGSSIRNASDAPSDDERRRPRSPGSSRTKRTR